MSDVERLKDIIRFEIEPGYFDRDYSEDSFEGVYKLPIKILLKHAKTCSDLKLVLRPTTIGTTMSQKR